MVVIKSTNEEISYAEILRRAKTEVSLDEIGMESVKVREAANGGLVLEIPGPESNGKADMLATCLRLVLGDNAVVTRPTKMGEVRITGLDVSTTSEEIQGCVTALCVCQDTEVFVGPLRKLPNGMRASWIRCPATSANILATKGGIRIGWAYARVDSFKIRPTQCFKCWHFGHVRGACKASTDRSGLCFRCGGAGHSYKACDSDIKCVVCADKGINAAHRLGSIYCPSTYRHPQKNGRLFGGEDRHV